MSQDLSEGTKNLPPLSAMWRNLLDLPRAMTLGSFISGLLIVVVAATGPIVIMLQAAQAGHFTSAQTATWICSSWATSGLFGLYLSLRYRMPMIGSTSTAAIVLLVTSLKSHSVAEAVASYMVVAILFIVVGATGLMPRIVKFIPHQIVMAMLAGILFTFGVSIFTNFDSQPWIVGAMVLAYFGARVMKLRVPVIPVLLVGVGTSALLHQISFHSPRFGITHLLWVSPHFTFGSIINLAFPIFLLTLATQFAPGFAVLKSNGYNSPHSASLITSGLISLVSAGYLNSGVNTSAITASIAVGEHADPNRSTRYSAGVVTGIFYIIAGVFGASILTLFDALTAAMLAALAGLALFPALASSMHEALEPGHSREAALATMVITISGIHPLQLGSPFWGLLAGGLLYALPNLRSRSA
jgi:benzoate membrane transport protein